CLLYPGAARHTRRSAGRAETRIARAGVAKAKSCSGSTANLEKDHSNESNANLFALGSIIFRSFCKRPARGSNVGFRHFGKGWPLARSQNGECAFTRGGAD